MRFLGLALFAEGPTDHRFLKPVLRRLTENLCRRHARAPVEVGEVLELHSLGRSSEEPRAARIRGAAEEAEDNWTVLFVHADGSRDWKRARRQQIDPALEELAALLRASRRAVAVVPVRETEAWVLADGDAVARAFGTTASLSEIGLAFEPATVERLRAPKRTLEAAFQKSRSGRRRKLPVAQFFEPLGESISLDRLRRVPAFARVEMELLSSLADLRVLDAERS